MVPVQEELPPPPEDWSERILARLHVRASDGWAGEGSPFVRSADVDGTQGTLVLTDRRLVYLVPPATRRFRHATELDAFIGEGGLEIPADSILETASAFAGDPLNPGAEASLSVRFRRPGGIFACTFHASEFAPGWAGFGEWEERLAEARARVTSPGSSPGASG